MMFGDDFSEADYLNTHPDVAAAVSSGTFQSGREHFDQYGKSEGRTWFTWTRENKILWAVDIKGRGLEIGPSHSPITPKRDGYNVDIVDHLDADGLKQKYVGQNVDLESIEVVDFVWNGEDLVELTGGLQKYDWIIASHVIEHIPDLVSFLQQAERLLKANGCLSLVLPDKRYCFDHFSATSQTGDILDAFHARRKRPSPGQVFDHHANAAKRNEQLTWASGVQGPMSLIHSALDAKTQWQRADIQGEYIDVHCWRFTPASFGLILSDLRALGLVGLSIARSFDTTGCEFYITLTAQSVPGEISNSAQRIDQLRTIDR